MSVRVFAVVTGPDPGPISKLATEYHSFAWNASRDDVLRFIDDKPADSVYAIVERVPDGIREARS